MFYVGGMLGLGFFLLVFSLAILDPQNIGWLMQANNQDAVQHFVGWEFYRNEPWGFPLGVIHNYGFPLTTSIVYTDSIPLLAFPFKLIANFLPVYFQYFGVWFALCYFLQGCFAWLISSEISDRPAIKILLTSFFILSPIMLNRVFEHQALAAHWALLAALWLYMRPQQTQTGNYWLVLNTLTVLIHAYLACMVLLIWSAFLYKQLFVTRTMTLKNAAWHVGATTILLLATGWVAGYFVIPLQQGIEAGGYGFEAMNLLAPFLPSAGSPIVAGDWSSFITKTLANTSVMQGDEGFNYFGIGMLLLIAVSLLQLLKRFPSKQSCLAWLPLLVLSGVFTLYAQSNEIYLGTWLIFHYPISSMLAPITDIFRASGRFFWPVYYLTMLLVFILLERRLHKTHLLVLLSVALFLQVADFSTKLNKVNQYFSQNHAIVSPLDSPFWEVAATRYHKLIFLPHTKRPQMTIAHFQDYIHYAALHHMQVNLGYFAREDTRKALFENRRFMRQVMQGDLASDTIYIIVKPQLALTQRPLDKADLREKIGRYTLIAPQWHKIK